MKKNRFAIFVIFIVVGTGIYLGWSGRFSKTPNATKESVAKETSSKNSSKVIDDHTITSRNTSTGTIASTTIITPTPETSKKAQDKGLPADRTPAAQPVHSSDFRTIEELQRAYGPNWRPLIDETEASKVPRSLLVRNATAPVLNKDNITDFVSQLRPLFGAENAELILKPQGNRPNRFDLDQRFKDFGVYGSYVRVITSPETSAPVTVINELQPLIHVDERTLLSAQEALEKVNSEILKPIKPLSLRVRENLVIYPLPNGEGVMAWIVQAQWIKSKKLEAKDFVVSALDGQILYTRNRLFN
jgi:hypothetical protein